VYQWPDGGGEAVIYQDHQSGSDLPSKTSRSYHGRREDGSTPRDVLAAARRARGRVRRLSRHGGFRWMWTLTFPAAVRDLADARRLLEAFMEGVSHRTPGGAALFCGAYIAVPELHKTHGWHWHILTNRRVQVEAVRVAWTAHLHNRGLTSASSPWARIHVKAFDSSRSASAYASKYVTKAVEGRELDGHHRYRVGHMVESPCPSYGLELGADVWEVALRVGQESSGSLWTTARLLKVESPGPPCVWVGW
jgi:hypothetical protein